MYEKMTKAELIGIIESQKEELLSLSTQYDKLAADYQDIDEQRKEAVLDAKLLHSEQEDTDSYVRSVIPDDAKKDENGHYVSSTPTFHPDLAYDNYHNVDFTLDYTALGNMGKVELCEFAIKQHQEKITLLHDFAFFHRCQHQGNYAAFCSYFVVSALSFLFYYGFFWKNFFLSLAVGALYFIVSPIFYFLCSHLLTGPCIEEYPYNTKRIWFRCFLICILIPLASMIFSIFSEVD